MVLYFLVRLLVLGCLMLQMTPEDLSDLELQKRLVVLNFLVNLLVLERQKHLMLLEDL
jgi:hypothetical protein